MHLKIADNTHDFGVTVSIFDFHGMLFCLVCCAR